VRRPLGCSCRPRPSKHHLSNAYRKLGLTSRTQLVRLVHDGTLALGVDVSDETT
jgi:hypothetical protein